MLTAVTDDIPFARKRLVSPKAVYSGLIDAIQFADSAELDSLLSTQDAWIAFNVSSSDVTQYAAAAAKANLKRVVFAICLNDDEKFKSDFEFENARDILKSSGVRFTFLKYGDVRQLSEAKFPYRVVRGALPLPAQQEYSLSSGDLMRIISEVVDIPKTFDSVYGVGPGTHTLNNIKYTILC